MPFSVAWPCGGYEETLRREILGDFVDVLRCAVSWDWNKTCRLAACFVNKVLLEYSHTCMFNVVYSSFLLQRQKLSSWDRDIWPKYLLSGFLLKKKKLPTSGLECRFLVNP